MVTQSRSRPQNVFLSVIIPTFNEEARVGPTIQSVDAYLQQQPYSYEVIVVDDGSRDSTVAVVREASRGMEQVKLLQHTTNYGKGWAVRSGMLNAVGRFRLFMDADGSTSISHWDKMQEKLESGVDVVVGSRHVEGSDIQVHQAGYRELLGSAFRSLVRLGFGLSVVDTQNGFKAFTADAAARIFRRQRVPGWAFDVEILSIARRLGYSTAEIPVTWIDDDRSRMTASAMPRMLAELVRIKMGVPEPRAAERLQEVPQWV